MMSARLGSRPGDLAALALGAGALASGLTTAAELVGGEAEAVAASAWRLAAGQRPWTIWATAWIVPELPMATSKPWPSISCANWLTSERT